VSYDGHGVLSTRDVVFGCVGLLLSGVHEIDCLSLSSFNFQLLVRISEGV
jgi:hypothetical protein